MNTSLIFTLYYLKELKIKLLDLNTRVIIIYILYQKKKIYIHLWRKVYNVRDNNKYSTFLVSSLVFVFSKHQISDLLFMSTYQFPEITRANH